MGEQSRRMMEGKGLEGKEDSKAKHGRTEQNRAGQDRYASSDLGDGQSQDVLLYRPGCLRRKDLLGEGALKDYLSGLSADLWIADASGCRM